MSARGAAASPPTFPNPGTAEAAAAELEERGRRSPRLQGIEQSRWTLATLRDVGPWLASHTLQGISKLLKRLAITDRRGPEHMHSPDPLYDEKLAAVTAARRQAQTDPGRHVFVYEDELTYYRRPGVAQADVRRGGPGAPARQGCRRNAKRRVLGALNALTGQLFVWQRSRTDVGTRGRYLRALEQEYPGAETIWLALDNWPVHFHDQVRNALRGSKIRLLRRPTYAPWTNPVEKVWRWLKPTVLHQHDFQDDGAALQQAVTRWLARWTEPSPAMLHYVGLRPVSFVERHHAGFPVVDFRFPAASFTRLPKDRLRPRVVRARSGLKPMTW